MDSYQPTQEQFARDVAKHRMKIVRDDGIHRHLLCRADDNSDYWFEVITWPHRLCITGDMGTWVFARLEDMFEFFRVDRTHGRCEINPDYWEEKIKSQDRQSGTRRGRGHTRRYIWCCRAIAWAIQQYDKGQHG
jgi:hypothetical protein